MLTKNELARSIEAETGIKPNLVKRVLDQLAAIAAEEVGKGEDFVVPGIAKIQYRYTAPQKKGERFKKGDTTVGFGGVEKVAEADSPARAEKARLVAAPTGAIARLKPSTKPDAQKDFFKSKPGKVVRSRKSK